MANRFANPSPQFFDNSGEPLSGGLLYFYVTGTSTPATTYSDDDLTTPNTNPVVLDSAGRAGNVFLDPTVVYKAVLKSDDGGTTFWTRDPVVDPAANVAASVAVYNGDPNGFVAGNAGSVGGSGASLVYDITNERLYVCITTGNAAAAVWQYIYDPISGQEDVRTADHTVTAANRGRTQVANKASAITFTLPAAATTGAGFTLPIKNIGAGALTIDGNAAELIDGAATITLGQYESCVIYCNGALWRTLGFKQAATDAEAIAKSSTQRFVTPANLAAVDVDYQAFTASGTWTKPAGVTASSRVHVEAWGAGGGGGANASGGAGGGGGYADAWFLASALSATETVTIPTGGAVNTVGGDATFGTRLTAYGGGAGQNGATGGGGGGGGQTSAGSSGSGGVGGAGGGPQAAAGGSGADGAFGVSGGGGGGNGRNGGSAYFGGGGGGGGTGFPPGSGGSSVYGGGGGGANASGPGGSSKFGGNGGAEGVAGSAPGGGGGRNAAGARGEIRVTTFI